MSNVPEASAISRRAPLVLLVEDDVEQIALIQAAFDRVPDQVTLTTVSTLQAARQYLVSHTPDLLITDLRLPDGDGRDLLIDSADRALFPVIILTGYDDELIAAEALNAGASDCVHKSPAAIQALPRIASRVLCGWQQILERRQAEEALRREREHLAGIIKAMPPVVVGMHADGKIRLVNPVCEQITGYSSAELKGRNWCKVLFAGEDGTHASQMLEEVRRNHRPVGREIPLVNRCGEKRFISWELTALRNEQGTIIELIALGTDVTERKQAEAISRIQTSALRAVANCVVITNRDGTITWVNPSFTRFTGYTLEEVLGKNPRILKSDKHDTQFYRQLWDTILSGRVWEGMIVNRRKDGSLYDEEMTITPVPDESGKITHFIAIKQDITERRKAERALEVYAKTMEQTARELAGITQMAEQARQDAERANKVKSEFLAKMSHELRTPLNSIIGFTELMIDDKQDVPNPKRANRLEKVHRNAKNLLALINDILDLSKIEADRLSLDFRWFDLDPLVRECVESTRPLVNPAVKLCLVVDPSVSQAGEWYG
ncbi:MAG: PAS domain S-box protein, partial [Phycisphaerae bacterium]